MSGRAARKKKLVRTRPVAESDESSDGEIALDVGAGEPLHATTRQLGPCPDLPPAHPPMGEAGGRWQRVRTGVDLKAGQISLASGTSWVGGQGAPAKGGNTKVPSRAKLDEASFQENHNKAAAVSGQSGNNQQPAHKSGFPFPGFLGNGTRRVSVSEPHVTTVVSEGEGSPPPPPPPDWSDPPPDRDHGEGGGTLADTDSESIPSSTHSSVLVDMGKVVGVLRTYTSSQADRAALLEPADSNGADDEDCDVSDDGESVTEGGLVGEVCATCAQEARGGQDSELDSLCGDPLVYATFVAPVHQYSTETEPSRQPSVKQNSSEAEGCPPPAPHPVQVSCNKTCFLTFVLYKDWPTMQSAWASVSFYLQFWGLYDPSLCPSHSILEQRQRSCLLALTLDPRHWSGTERGGGF